MEPINPKVLVGSSSLGGAFYSSSHRIMVLLENGRISNMSFLSFSLIFHWTMIMGESASTLAPWVTGVCCFEAIWLYQGATVPSFEPPEEEEAQFLGGLQGGHKGGDGSLTLRKSNASNIWLMSFIRVAWFFERILLSDGYGCLLSMVLISSFCGIIVFCNFCLRSFNLGTGQQPWTGSRNSSSWGHRGDVKRPSTGNVSKKTRWRWLDV